MVLDEDRRKYRFGALCTIVVRGISSFESTDERAVIAGEFDDEIMW